jgi:site-specific recombinase XerD
MSSGFTEDLVKEYDLMVLEKMSKNSRKEYHYNLMEFRKFQEERGKDLIQPTALDLAEYLKYKRTTCSGQTLNRKFYAIKKFFVFLKKKDLMDPKEFDFLDEIKPKTTKGDEAHRSLSEPEVQRCLTNISHPLYRFIFFLGVEFGIRREEYTNLKISDVDFNQKRLRIHGKGDKVRFIPMTKAQINRFQQFFQQRERDGINHDYLLYSKTGKVLKRTLERYFIDMSTMAGVKFTSHDIRVTFATRLWKAGLDIFVVSQMLGHASIQQTLTYLKPTQKEIEDRYRAIVENLYLPL